MAFDWKSIAEEHLLWKNTLVKLSDVGTENVGAASDAPVLGVLRGLGPLGQLVVSVNTGNPQAPQGEDVFFLSGSVSSACRTFL